MNIFVVNNDPILAATDLPDKLIVKMPVESLQLLTPWAYNAHSEFIKKPDGTNYGIKGYAHHPCSKWLYINPGNVAWLLEHAVAMSEEYTKRYGKQHGVNYGLLQLGELFSKVHGDTRTMWTDHSNFVQAMPIEFKIPDDPVTAYRNYIIGYKGYAEWRYSEKPNWWDQDKHEPVRKQYLLEKEAKRLERQHVKHSRVQTTV